MTCKDCVHFGVCGKERQFLNVVVENRCKTFFDKEKCIILPCKLGTKVYRVLYINTPDDEYYCSFSKEWVIRQGNFTLEDCKNFGKTVFFTYEEAEKALKECESND